MVNCSLKIFQCVLDLWRKYQVPRIVTFVVDKQIIKLIESFIKDKI